MTYPGGKNGDGTYQKIINLMPPHHLYVEAFLGSGAILRFKRPAMASIGIDSDAYVLDHFQGDVPGLTLLNTDAISWLARTAFSDDTLIYLDPPYVMSSRSQQRAYYRHEFTDEQHRDLLAVITGLPCMVVLSGYYSDMYAEALSGWRTFTFQVGTRGGRTATEWVWMNYPEPMELHDYRYLGGTFRERERIKRKRNRWKARLERMKPQERHAILWAIDELRSGASPSVPVGAPIAGSDEPAVAPEMAMRHAVSAEAAMGTTAGIAINGGGRPGALRQK